MQPIQVNPALQQYLGDRPIVIHVVKQNRGCLSKYPGFKSWPAGICGGGQLLLGVLSIVFQAVSMAQWYTFTVSIVGYAYFSPILWFISGSFGLGAAGSKNMCTIVTSLIMNIISAVTIIYFIPLSASSLDSLRGSDYGYDDYGGYICDEGTTIYYNSNCHYVDVDPSMREETPERRISIAMESMIVAVGVLEGILAILSAVCCCRVLCCGRGNSGVPGQETIAQVQYLVNPGTRQQGPSAAEAGAAGPYSLQAMEKGPLPQTTAPVYVLNDPPPPYNLMTQVQREHIDPI